MTGLHRRLDGIGVQHLEDAQRRVRIARARALQQRASQRQAVLARLSQRFPAGPEAELLMAGRWESSLEVATGEALERLRTEVGVRVVDVPRLSTEAGVQRLVHNMAAALARSSQRGLKA